MSAGADDERLIALPTRKLSITSPHSQHHNSSNAPSGSWSSPRSAVHQSYQHLRDAAMTSSDRPLHAAREGGTPPNSKTQPELSLANHSATPRSGELQKSSLEREIEARRSAQARLESENLTLLKELTNVKLSEEKILHDIQRTHALEVEGLREKLNRMAEEQERELSRRLEHEHQTRSQNGSEMQQFNRQQSDAILLMQRTLTAKDSEIRDLSQRIAQSQGRHSEVMEGKETELRVLNGRIEGLEALLREKEEVLSHGSTFTDSNRKQVDERNGEITRLQRQVENLSTQLEHKGDEVMSLQRQLTTQANSSRDQREKCDSLQSQLATVEMKLFNKEASDSNAMLEMREELRGAIKRIEVLAEQLSNANTTIEQRDSQLRQQLQETNTADERRRAAEMLTRQKSEEIHELTTLHEVSRLKVIDLTSRVATLEMEVSIRTQQEAESAALLQRLREEQEMKEVALRVRSAAAGEDAESVRSALTRAQRELQQEQEVTIRLMQRIEGQEAKLVEFDEVKSQLDQAAHDLKRRESTIQEHQRHQEEMIRRIISLEKELDEARAGSAQIAFARDELEQDYTSQLQENERLIGMSALASELELRLLERDDELKVKHEEIQLLTVAYEELRHHAQHLQGELGYVPTLERSVTEMIEDKKTLLHQFEQAQTTMLSEREALSRMTSMYEATKKNLQEARDELTIASAGAIAGRALEAELRRMDANVKQKELEIEDLKTSKHKIGIELETSLHEQGKSQSELITLRVLVDDLRAQLRRSEERLAGAQQELGKVQVRDEELLRREAKHSAEVEAQRIEASNLQSQLEASQLKLAERDEEVRLHLESIALLQATSADLTSKLALKSQGMDESKSLYQDVCQRLMQCEEQKSALEQKASSTAALEGKLKAVMSALEAKSNELVSVLDENQSLKDFQRLSEKHGNVRRALEETIDQLRHAASRQSEELLNATTTAEELRRRLAQVDSERLSGEKDMKRMSDSLSLEKKRCEALTEEIAVMDKQAKTRAALEGKMRAMEEINEDLRAQLTKSRSDYAALQMREKRDDGLRDTLREAQHELKGAQSLIAGKDSTIKMLEDELEKKSTQLQQYRRDLGTRESSHASMTEELQDTKRTVMRLLREVDDLSRNRQEKQKELDVERYHSKYEDSKFTAASAEMAERLRQANERAQALEAKLKSREEERLSLLSKIEQLEHSKSKVEVDCSILSAALEDCRQQLQSAQTELLASRKQNSRDAIALNEQEKVLDFTRGKYETDLLQRDEDMEGLAKTIDDLKRHVHLHQSQQNTHRDETEQLKGMLRSAQSTILTMQKDIDNSDRELRTLRQSTFLAARAHSSSVSLSPSPPRNTIDASQLSALERQLATEQGKYRALQQQHDTLVASIEGVKKAFSMRELSLNQEVTTLRRQIEIITDEKDQLRASLKRLR